MWLLLGQPSLENPSLEVITGNFKTVKVALHSAIIAALLALIEEYSPYQRTSILSIWFRMLHLVMLRMQSKFAISCSWNS